MEFSKRLRIQSCAMNKHCYNMYGLIAYLETVLDNDLAKVIAKFEIVVVLPSPGPGLLTRITLHSLFLYE